MRYSILRFQHDLLRQRNRYRSGRRRWHSSQIAKSSRWPHEFSADEALKQGFVSRVLSSKEELVAEGLKLAQLIASKSPVAVQGTKNVLDYAWGRTVEENNNYVAVWNAGMLQSTDVERAMTSGLQKRKPTFEKL
jgi:delta(3,5)-delta(2,4)-dienoyl-CoA isomerase